LLVCFALLPCANAADENSPEALVERGLAAMRTNPEDSRRDAEAALAALASRPDVDLEIRARLLLCDYFSERDQPAAEKQIALMNTLLPRAHRSALRAGVMTCQGELRETVGDNAAARSLYEGAVRTASATADAEMLAGALFSRGYLLGLEGEYAAGLTDLRHSQSLYQQIRMPRHALTALNGVAILYNRMGDYAQAKHMYRQALDAQHAAGMVREEAVTWHNLGRAHENLREWEQARRAFAEALQLSQQIGYTRAQAYALRGLGAVAAVNGDPLGALSSLERADALQHHTPDARLHALIALTRGTALHALKRLPESIAALEDARRVFHTADALGDLATTYRELAAVYAAMGNWRSAYERESDFAQVSEQLLNNQLDQRFETLKVEFDTAAKEQENAVLTRENEAGRLALAQGRSMRRLQAAVIALTVLLAVVLATLVMHQRGHARRMRVLAMTDELTGVPNRRAVLTRLGELLAAAAGPPCSVLIMDIDHFKSINDHHGHPAGDEVLKVIAATVRNAVHEPAFFGRLGGEEFLIVLPRTPLPDAQLLAEGFREQIMSIETSSWFAVRRIITASVGLTVSEPGHDTSSSMLRRADAALYVAKRAGRNCVRAEPAVPSEATATLLGDARPRAASAQLGADSAAPDPGPATEQRPIEPSTAKSA
jgi:diguanylate cyclase (GGDEF)-like protein